MKAQIADKEILRSIATSEITAYLLSKGAEKTGDFAGKATIWQYHGEELVIPLSSHYADYVLRIAQILKQFENVEQRSQLAILDDIKHITYDVIRVRNVSSDTRDGTLGFSKTVDFIAHTREMLLAAACSASSQKIHYPSKKPQEAEDFLKNVRFGKTEKGSFVLTLLSPVSPDLNTQCVLLDELEEMPYEKKVIPTLESGLIALNHAAQNATMDKSLDHFTNAAPKGVTTNLCDAVASMYENLTPEYIEVSIAYSGNRNNPRPLARINIDRSYIPVIREASTNIKNIEPEPEQVVRGIIVKLDSTEPQEFGSVTLKDITPARPRNISIKLHGEEYSRAIDAHKEKVPVEFSGTIKKSGRTTYLEPTAPFGIFSLEE